MAEVASNVKRAHSIQSTTYYSSEFLDEDSEMKKKNTSKSSKKAINSANVSVQAAEDIPNCSKSKPSHSKATQCENTKHMHVSIRELLVDENNKIVGRTHIEKRFEHMNRKATVDSIMDMINKNQMPSSIRDALLPWFKKQQEKERLCQTDTYSSPTNKFISAQSMLNKLPVKQRKIFIDLYEENLLKQEKIQNERVTQEILREAKNCKSNDKLECHCEKTQIKRGFIKVRDEKELLQQPGIVGKGDLSSVDFAKCEKEVVKFIKENVEASPVRLKEVKVKQMKLDEVCRNTINLLKFQRTHSVTYMHDVLPFLRAIYKEYKSKQMPSISAHEILVLDQIAYNVEFYWEISNTERLYKETMLDGHILLSRHITKLIEGILISLNSKDILKDTTGNFIFLMDAALERIHDIDLDQYNKNVNSDICEEVLEIVKEILCTAYSIALVCEEYDSDSIKGTSKTIFDDLNAIKKQVNNSVTNTSMCNLLIDSFCDNLCALERKLNTTVLRLTIETFLAYDDRVNDLYFHCTDNKTTDKHKKCIDVCVGRVDNEMDKIMQVGWFAISCSGYSKHSRNLRNALATIEALEDELVPGLVIMKKRANETYMEIILIRMLEAIKDMKQALYHIMDPLAFCLVARLQVEKTVAKLKEELGKGIICYENHHRNIHRYFVVVQEMVKNSINTDEGSFETCQLKLITDARGDSRRVLEEIQKRLDQLALEPSNLELELKILKRYKVFRHEFSKLIKLAYCYEKEMNADVIKETQPKVETNNGFLVIAKTTKVALDYVELKAQKNLKIRSIIGNTMMNNNDCLKIVKNSGKPNTSPFFKLAEKRTLVKHFWSHNETLLNNEDLEITTVLNEICDKSKY